MAKQNKLRYRRKSRYIQKYFEWLESPAYRDLTPLARCLLDEFQMIYLPSRNGRLNLPLARAAERLGVSENTAMHAYDALIEHGFLALAEPSDWVQRRARLWRLTFEECGGREPTDDWKKWEPTKPVAVIHRKNKRPKKLRQAASNIEANNTQKLRQQR